MRQSSARDTSHTAQEAAKRITDMLARLHVLVIGPGLGRDALMGDICKIVIKEARQREMPVVIDADGLQLVQNDPDLVHGYCNCILTPNVVEFRRLAESQGLTMPPKDQYDDDIARELCQKLAQSLGGVTVVQKGKHDYISNGQTTFVSDGQGGLKRSGGQGDTLTGTIATLLAYRKAYLDNLWSHGRHLGVAETLALAAWGGSAVTREASRLAFAEKGRSLQASDLTESVHAAFENLIGEPPAKL